jgi:hypothetical protein
LVFCLSNDFFFILQGVSPQFRKLNNITISYKTYLAEHGNTKPKPAMVKPSSKSIIL